MEIAVISGKGGTGKSSISAAFATLNKKVVLADCDVDAANLHILFEESYFHPVFKKEETKQKRVTLYSTPSCSWCNVLKNHLKASNIRFTEVDVSQNQEAAEQMVRRSGQRGVPQTDIDGQIIVGFDKNKINSLLGIQ